MARMSIGWSTSRTNSTGFEMQLKLTNATVARRLESVEELR